MWEDVDDRAAAIIDVLKHLAGHQDEAQRCLKNDAGTRDLFSNGPGRINPPVNIKIVLLPCGQVEMKGRGSVVIEVPERANDETLTNSNTRCCYNYWKPLPSK